jgi:hypothetical protein
VRDGAHIVEQLAQDIPPAFAFDYFGAEKCVAGNFYRMLQKKPLAFVAVHIAQSFIVTGKRTVCGFRGGGKPAFIYPAPVCPERVQVRGMEPQSPARNHE